MYNISNIVYSRPYKTKNGKLINLKRKTNSNIDNIYIQTPKLSFYEFKSVNPNLDILTLALLRDNPEDDEMLSMFRTFLFDLDDKFQTDKCLSKLRNKFEFKHILRTTTTNVSFPITLLDVYIEKELGSSNFKFETYNEKKSLIANPLKYFQKGYKMTVLLDFKTLNFDNETFTYFTHPYIAQLQIFKPNQLDDFIIDEEDTDSDIEFIWDVDDDNDDYEDTKEDSFFETKEQIKEHTEASDIKKNDAVVSSEN